MKYKEPLVIGCHHKTGTQLLGHILETVATRIWSPKEIAFVHSQWRKLPLSDLLETLGPDYKCVVDVLFEHEVDVRPLEVRFLNFVRHPAKWIRSAYLYHKKGAPSEIQRWVDWKIFEIGGKKLSYRQLLNNLNDDTGIMVEAVRSYPDVAGTARAAKTSSHLKKKLQISLEQIAADFPGKMADICEFLGLDSADAANVVDQLRAHDIQSKDMHQMPVHATHHAANAQDLEQYLLGDPSFNMLYAPLAKQMGFSMSGHTLRASSPLSLAFADRIINARPQLLTHLCTKEAEDFLQNMVPGNSFMVYALQTFGAGHLTMYEFIQAMLTEIDIHI